MECLDICYAARSGQLSELIAFMRLQTKDEVTRLVSTRTHDVTPLMAACERGHVDVVTYLLEACHADVEQVGRDVHYISNGRMPSNDVSPLWCACAYGHLNIVKTLLEHKALVNGVTNTKSIPLHIACSEGYFRIVEYLINHGADIENANSSGSTCLMIACLKRRHKISKYLVDCGADVNRKCIDGSTVLHASATSGCLEILKILLDHGAGIYTDKWGITPLLYAADSGEEEIVDYFIKECKCTKQDTVDALELLGVSFVHSRQGSLGLDYWKRAMELRYEDSAFVLEKPKNRSYFSCCVGATEVRTADEIEGLIADHDEMRTQALLIKVRIMGDSYPLVLAHLKHMCTFYACIGNSERCIQLFMFVLDTEQRVQPPLCLKTYEVIVSFTRLFTSSSFRFQERASIRDVFLVLEKILKVIESAFEKYPYSEIHSSANFSDWCVNISYQYAFTLHVLYFLNVMCKKLGCLQPRLNTNEESSLKNAARKLVTLNPRSVSGATPLHSSSFNASVHLDSVTRCSSAEVVHLLLEVGACPSALDCRNNTPLHSAAKARPFDADVFHLLLKYGAHLDCRNNDNQTPLQLVPDASVLNIKPLHYTDLQCLCAQAIQVHKIPYEGLLHKKLNEFVHLHCSD